MFVPIERKEVGSFDCNNIEFEIRYNSLSHALVAILDTVERIEPDKDGWYTTCYPFRTVKSHHLEYWNRDNSKKIKRLNAEAASEIELRSGRAWDMVVEFAAERGLVIEQDTSDW
jgi:hypothetical protein